jgi:hypothetical protein
VFDYTPAAENKTYFKSSFLETFWFQTAGAKITELPYQVISSRIAVELGNGRTFDRLKYWTPLVITAFGFVDGLEILYQGLDLSSANDKNQRRKEIHKFAQKIERKPIPAQLALAA